MTAPESTHGAPGAPLEPAGPAHAAPVGSGPLAPAPAASSAAPPARSPKSHRRSGRLDLEVRAALRRSTGLPPPGIAAATLTLRLDPELVALVDVVAEALGLSRSDTMRRLLLRGAEAALARADGEADRSRRRPSRAGREPEDAPWRGARRGARGPGAVAASVVDAARAAGRYVEGEVQLPLDRIFPPWHPQQ